MKLSNAKSWGAALGAGILTTVVMLPQARGELVYENDGQAGAVLQAPVQAPVQQAQSPRAEDRQLMRQNLQTAERANATVQAQQLQPQAVLAPVAQAPATQAPAAVVPVAVTPVVSAPAPQVAPATDELQNLSKSELMRRERVRTELKNEDILQERLEELRLRDERRRTDHLLGVQSGAEAAQPVGQVGPAFQLPKEEVVAAPLTERPGQVQAVVQPVAPVQAVQPVQPQVQVASVQIPAPQDQFAASHSTAVSSSVSENGEKTIVYVQPRFGISNFNGQQAYDIRPRYSGGLTLGVGISDNLSFEAGYTYSEFGIALNSTNPLVIQAQMMAGAQGYNGTFESQVMKRNVGELGLKIHLLGPDARLRPFIGGGGAYAKSFLNYNQNILTAIDSNPYYANSNLGRDYDLSQYLGFLSTGFDVRVSKAIAVGATFKYFTVLSSRQNQDINNLALAGGYQTAGYGYPGYYPGYAYPYATTGMPDYDKQTLGGSLAQNSFYSIEGAVTFSF